MVETASRPGGCSMPLAMGENIPPSCYRYDDREGNEQMDGRCYPHSVQNRLFSSATRGILMGSSLSVPERGPDKCFFSIFYYS